MKNIKAPQNRGAFKLQKYFNIMDFARGDFVVDLKRICIFEC